MLEGAQNQYEISSGLVDKNESIEHYIEKLVLSAVMIFFFGGFWGVFCISYKEGKRSLTLMEFFFPQLLIFPDTGVTYNKLLLFSSEMFGFKFLDHFTVNNFQLNLWSFCTSTGSLKLTIKV